MDAISTERVATTANGWLFRLGVCDLMIRLISVLSVFAAFGFITGAHAESTRFYCSTEDAAENVAERIVINGETLDEVVVPVIKNGTCFWFASEIEILVLRKGKVFKSNGEGVFVVAFMITEKDGGLREYYALVRYNPL